MELLPVFLALVYTSSNCSDILLDYKPLLKPSPNFGLVDCPMRKGKD